MSTKSETGPNSGTTSISASAATTECRSSAMDVGETKESGDEEPPFAKAYELYRAWALESLDVVRGELLALCFPLFTHCYLDLLRASGLAAAQEFASAWSADHTDLYDEELQSVLAVTDPMQLLDAAGFILEHRVLEALRLHKFTVHLSRLSHSLLIQFLSCDHAAAAGALADPTGSVQLLLASTISEKLHVVVGPGELPLDQGRAGMPAWELYDHIPGANRRAWPQLDSYTPTLAQSLLQGCSGAPTKGVAPPIPAAAPTVHNPRAPDPRTSCVRLPDTKNDDFYVKVVNNLVMPHALLHTPYSAIGTAVASMQQSHAPSIQQRSGSSSALTSGDTTAPPSGTAAARKRTAAAAAATAAAAAASSSAAAAVAAGEEYAQYQNKLADSASCPSVLFFTVTNTTSSSHVSAFRSDGDDGGSRPSHAAPAAVSLQSLSTLICADISRSGSRLACGFQDSVVRVWNIGPSKYTPDTPAAAAAVTPAMYLEKLGKFDRIMYDVLPQARDHSHRCAPAACGVGSSVGSGEGGGMGLGQTLGEGVRPTGRSGGTYRAPIHGQHVATNATGAPPGHNMIELVGHSKPVFAIAQHTESNLLLSGAADMSIRLWNTALAKCVAKFSTMGPIWDVAFAPFGYYFVAAGHDRTACVYSTDRQNAPLRVLVGHTSDVTSVRYHPNSALVATGSDDKTCRLFDMRTSRCVRYFRAPTCSSISCIDVSPNGVLIAAGAHNASAAGQQGHVWDIGSGRLQAILSDDGTGSTTHARTTTHSIAFDATSTVLATGDSDGAVKTWAIDSLRPPSLHMTAAQLAAECAGTNGRAAVPVALIEPTSRLMTKFTPVLGVRYAAYGGRAVLYAGGPLDAGRAKAWDETITSERQAFSALGVGYAVPDVR